MKIINKFGSTHLLILLLLSSFSFVSCKKDSIVTPNQQLALFTTTEGSYFITDDASSAFKVPLGLTQVATKDTKIEFSVSSPSGALQGQQYKLGSETIVIPAGKTVDSIILNGIFAAYPTGRRDTLVFKITGGDVPSLIGSDVYTVVLQKYCEVNLDDLLGDYNNSSDGDADGDYGPYTTTVVSATSTGPTTAKLMIKYAGDYYFGPFGATDPSIATGITVNIDWTDPADFFTTIPTQPMGVTSPYGMVTVTAAGKGSFSSCDNTLSISYKATVSAGSFGNILTTLRR